MRDLVLNRIKESAKVKETLKTQTDKIVEIVKETVDTLRRGRKVVLFGNGGSAADAQHIAAEFVGRFQIDRGAMPAISLTTNTSILTAIANDASFDEIFARQVEAVVTEKDLVIGISTSGLSKNVLRGIQAARKKGAKTVGLTGGDGGELATIVDIPLVVPSNSTPRIQEAHIMIGHIICELAEKELCE